jgi:hypothetical protein
VNQPHVRARQSRRRLGLGKRCGALLRAWVLLCLAGPAGAACPPAGQDLAALQSLKAASWQLPPPGADAARADLALALLDCLAAPDPAWRDGIAFDALQAWMRRRQLDEATVRQIRLRLLARLAAPADADGFAQPFAALVLAEVARVDRLQPFLSDAERADTVVQAARYLSGVRDYRGFDAPAGWRHGVAHGADLALQLSLNPALDRAMGDTLLAAVAAQVMPAGAQAWRFGEPERLMAPVFYLAQRSWWSAADWQVWFDTLAARRDRPPAPTAHSLAQRHNLAGFLMALYVAVQEAPDAERRARLLPGLRSALKSLD